MPKINVYLPDDLAASVRDAKVPVSAICQSALERAVRDVTSARATEVAPSDDGMWTGLFGRFTTRAREAVVTAERLARDVPHDYVGTEHVLLGVLDEGQNLAIKVLLALDVDPADLRAELEASLLPPTKRVEGHVPFTPLAKEALGNTAKEAMTLGHNYVGCEHLLLGMLATEDCLASKVLRRMGLELRITRRAVVTALFGIVHAQRAPAVSAVAEKSTLDAILERLEAIEGRLDR